MKLFSFISCLRTRASVDAMNLGQGTESFHPARFLETDDRDSRQGLYTTRQTTNRPFRNKNVKPLAGFTTLGGTILLSVPVLGLLRPISYNIRRPVELLFLLCDIFRSFLPRQLVLSMCVFCSLAAQHIERQMSASSGIRKDVKGNSHGLTLYPVLLKSCARIYGRHGGHVT